MLKHNSGSKAQRIIGAGDRDVRDGAGVIRSGLVAFQPKGPISMLNMGGLTCMPLTSSTETRPMHRDGL